VPIGSLEISLLVEKLAAANLAIRAIESRDKGVLQVQIYLRLSASSNQSCQLRQDKRTRLTGHGRTGGQRWAKVPAVCKQLLLGKLWVTGPQV